MLPGAGKNSLKIMKMWDENKARHSHWAMRRALGLTGLGLTGLATAG
jgi:hypothetical protein